MATLENTIDSFTLTPAVRKTLERIRELMNETHNIAHGFPYDRLDSTTIDVVYFFATMFPGMFSDIFKDCVQKFVDAGEEGKTLKLDTVIDGGALTMLYGDRQHPDNLPSVDEVERLKNYDINVALFDHVTDRLDDMPLLERIHEEMDPNALYLTFDLFVAAFQKTLMDVLFEP